MNATTTYFASTQFSQTLGWTLFHFLWQGIVIAAIVAVLLGLLARRSSNARYLVACCGLLMMALCPALTFGWLQANQFESSSPTLIALGSPDEMDSNETSSVFENEISHRVESTSAAVIDAMDDGESRAIVSASAGSVDSKSTVASISSWSQQARSFLQPLLPWVVGVWLAGVVLLSLRMLVCWSQVNRLKKTGVLLVNESVNLAFQQLSERLGLGERVRLLQSSVVIVPTVIGYIKPVVLMPAAVLTGLSPQQLAAVIAHELSHVRRADYLVNLFQSVIETVLFYHPCVWWLSGSIRTERENCCDDLAAEVCGSPRNYAEALLKLEQLKPSPHLAMGADGGSLVDRVSRLLGKSRSRATGPYWLAGFGSLMIALLAFSILVTDQRAQATPVADVISSPAEMSELDSHENSVAAAETVQEDRTMVITVLDENGDPLKGAHIHAGIWSDDRAFPPNQSDNTDAKGRVTINLPNEFRILRLWASNDGYARLFTNWEEDNIKNGDMPPAAYTFRMIKGATIGGVIVDESDKPVVGAKIGIQAGASHPDGKSRLRFGSWYANTDNGTLVTDAEGRWSLNTLPPAADLKVTVKTVHPDYIDDPKGESYKAQGIKTADLLAGTARIVMSKGIAVTGTITDSEGKPIEDGLVVWGDRPYWEEGRQEMEIGLDGVYEMPALPPGEKRITVMAPGYRPETKVIKIKSMMENINFEMVPGRTLTVQIVDGKTEEPIPGSYLGIEGWKGAQSIYNHQHPNVIDSGIPHRANELGVYQWTWAPDEKVQYQASARGYTPRFDVWLKASDEIQLVKLFKPLEVSGDVVSKATGKTIDSFTVTPLRYHDLENQPDDFGEQKPERGREGLFKIKTHLDGSYRFKIESPGFESFLTEMYAVGDDVPRLNIELVKATWRNGVVVDAAGNPVSGADVKLASKTKVVSLRKYLPSDINATRGKTTGENGEFAYPHSKEPETFLVLHKSGFAEVVKQPGEDIGEIQLKPWAKVQGTVYNEMGQPVPNVSVAFEGSRFQYDHNFHVQDLTAAVTDQDGKYEFPRLPPIKGVIRTLSHMTEAIQNEYVIPVDLSLSEEFNIDLGEQAITVSGRLNVTGRSLTDVDYSPTRAVVMPVSSPPFGLPEMLTKHDWRNGWKEVQRVTSANHYWPGRTYLNSFSHCKVQPNPDGQFTVQVKEAGTYDVGIVLNVGAAELGDGVSAHSLGEGTLRFEVDEAALKAGKLELGTIDVAAFATPSPGAEVPDFEFELADGQKVRLNDQRGHYLLLDFWAAWCASCEADKQKLKQLAESLVKKDSSSRMISIETPGSGNYTRASEETGEVWLAGKMIYVRGQTKASEYEKVYKKLGVSSLPCYMVIDPKGKLVYQGNIDGAVEKMQELK